MMMKDTLTRYWRIETIPNNFYILLNMPRGCMRTVTLTLTVALDRSWDSFNKRGRGFLLLMCGLTVGNF